MIEIDKDNSLYKYLTALGVEDIDNEYLLLAKNGRYLRKDIQAYYRDIFRPSATTDIEESEIEKILDYHTDLRRMRKVSKRELSSLLDEYSHTKSREIRDKILSSQLKDVLYMCINYHTMHKDSELDELVQVANLGLIEALDHYNSENKIDFKDYIVYWIREKIIKEFEEKKNG